MGRPSLQELVSRQTKGMAPEEAEEFKRKWFEEHSAKRKAAQKEAQLRYNKSEKHKAKNKRHRWKNKTIYKEKKKASDKAYVLKNHTRLKLQWAEYRLNNKDEINRRIHILHKKRRKEDPAYLLACRSRTRIGNFLRSKGSAKAGKTFELIGCTPRKLQEYLNFHRIGDSSDVHIDHIFPIVMYETDEESQRKFMHFSNLQLLTKKENIHKSNKLPTKDMAAKVDRDKWPDGVTEDMLPDIYDGWSTSTNI